MMQKVKNYLSLTVVAALLLLCSIGFAQTKKGTKKPKNNASEVVETPMQSGKNANDKSSDEEDAKGSNKRSFLITANLFAKMNEALDIPRTYSVVANNNDIYTVYNATVDEQKWKTLCGLFSENRLEQGVFLNSVLPKALVFESDKVSAQNYAKALKTFFKNRPELIFLGPEFMKEYNENPNEIAFKIFGMQQEMGNIIKTESIKLN